MCSTVRAISAQRGQDIEVVLESTSRWMQLECCSEHCLPRVFVLPLNNTDCTGSFSLNDLGAGRIDLLCRFITAAYFLSHAFRRNVGLLSLMTPRSGESRLLTIGGADTKHLRPDERNMAVVLKRLFEAKTDPDSKQYRCISGFSIRNDLTQLTDAVTLAATTIQKYRSGFVRVFVLSERGTLSPQQVLDDDLRPDSVDPCAGVVIVVGDNRGMSQEEADMISGIEGENLKVAFVSLGPVALLASHCVVLVHAILDQYHHCPRHTLGRYVAPSPATNDSSEQRE